MTLYGSLRRRVIILSCNGHMKNAAVPHEVPLSWMVSRHWSKMGRISFTFSARHWGSVPAVGQPTAPNIEVNVWTSSGSRVGAEC